ncbi:N-6 DNA methylase [Streptomyces sp. PA03-3a]|nr:N-6 DNA methylase [Streptomyces sp. PA03-3a]
MSQPSALVTAAEISRIAGVTRATVSNWRRRHEDFPSPAGGTEASPLYDLEAVRAWLQARGHSAAATPAEELRTLLRLHGAGIATRLLPMVLAAARRSPEELSALTGLSDPELGTQADSAVAALAGAAALTATVHFPPDDAPALRALLRCVRDAGPRAALDVLAERELEESTASGTYQTPAELAVLMARLLPADSIRVLDPACGSGTLLETAAAQGARELYGQDALEVQAQRTAVRLLLSAPDAQVSVSTGDSLRSDAYQGTAADGVLCNPPYGDRDWGQDELAYDPRWAYGVPPRAESELAWVQHALAHLVPGGYAVLLLPPATAARASGRRVRAELVRAGTLRAVVGLPAGAAAPLHIGLQIWVLQRPEPGGAERKSVLFMDLSGGREDPASSSRQRSRRAAPDWDDLSKRILDHWTAFRAAPDSVREEPGVARAVPVIDLLGDLVDLTPARQVRAAPADVDPAEVARLVARHREQLTRHIASLAEAAGHDVGEPAGDSTREWRTATVSDLVRGGALEILRATPQTKEGSLAKWRAANADRPVLTGADIAHSERASAGLDDLTVETAPLIEEGDVLVRAIPGGQGSMARVADEADAGAVPGRSVFVLRPDPARLDPWFVMGFLEAEDNVAGASTGSTTVHVQPGRLRVPLLSLEEQQRYGVAFRRVHDLRTAARRTVELAQRTADALTAGLTGGGLLPSRAETP